jgi:DNA polymerase-3 subunit gamma/tau
VSYQVLARKWRPRKFDEMVGQEHVLRALANALDTGRIHHAFLFTGTRGVGKTTLARIFAKSLNCEQGISSTPCGVCSTCQEIDSGRFIDLIEVDAASRTKVEDTRELLDNVQYAPTRGRYKVYLVDEVHMLSNHSFNALLKTLEEPPEHVKFLLATTDPQKLPVTILSRCLQFNLRRLHPDLISGYLAKLLTSEQLEFEEAALQHLARAADGSMRDALSLLDQAIAYGSGKVLDADVKQMLGTIEQTHLYRILSALAQRNSEVLYNVISELKTTTPDYSDVISNLLSVLHYVALLQQIPAAYDPSMGDEASLRDLARLLSPEDVQLFYQIGINGQRDLNYAPEPSMGVEMTLLRMLAFKPVNSEGLNTAPPAQPGSANPLEQNRDKQVTPTQIASEDAAPAITATEQSKKPELLNDWSAIVTELKLGGLLNQLAMNCSLLEKSDDRIVLALDPTFENLLTKERQENLKEALTSFYNKNVLLEIEVKQAEKETPAMQEKREEQARLDAAQQAIEDDANVKKILDTFQAQISTDTIQPK